MPEMKEIWPGWETVRVVGKGGFGKVYEVRKIDENAAGDYRSALKVISIPPSEDDYLSYKDDGYDEESITSIFRNQMSDIEKEFALMAQFKGTSHIVSYEEHRIVPNERTHGWDILIRMELLTSLPNYYNQKNGLEEAEVIKLGIDICKALELCGRKGIVHRDIKPQNIFVNEFGDFKLGDFGIARSMEHTTGATKTGTYAYMAPEIYQGRPYNASVDMYSLGLVLYWLLNERRLPFMPLPPAVPSNSQNDEAQRRRLSGETIPVPKYGSRDLHAVILQACACDPKKRFRNVKDMERALEGIFADLDEEEASFWEEDEPEGGVLISGPSEGAAGEAAAGADGGADQRTVFAKPVQEEKPEKNGAGRETIFVRESMPLKDAAIQETVFTESGQETVFADDGEDQETVFADGGADQETVFADDGADQETVFADDGAGREQIAAEAVQEAVPDKDADGKKKISGRKAGGQKPAPGESVDHKKKSVNRKTEAVRPDNDGKKGPGAAMLGKYAVSMYIGLALLSMWYLAHRTFGYYLAQSGLAAWAMIGLRLCSLLALGLGAVCTSALVVNAQKDDRKELHDAIHMALFLSLITGTVSAGIGCLIAPPCGLIFVSLIPLSVCACLFTLLWTEGRARTAYLVLLAVQGGNYLLCGRVLILQRLYSAEAVGIWGGIASLCLETIGAVLLVILWNRTCGQDKLRLKDLRIYKTGASASPGETLPLVLLGMAPVLFAAGIFLSGTWMYQNVFAGFLNLYGLSFNGTSAYFGLLALFLSTIVLEARFGSMRKRVLTNILLGIGFIVVLWLFGAAFYNANGINRYTIGGVGGLYLTALCVGYLFTAVSYTATAGLWRQKKAKIALLLVCTGMAAGCLLFGAAGRPEEQYILKYVMGWMCAMILLLICGALVKRKRKEEPSIGK